MTPDSFRKTKEAHPFKKENNEAATDLPYATNPGTP
eukprot:CAMPEP_0204630072 /NCGR_PEP_ID=MMETSP0717-20131115/19531_1 /ASSEMBLY_ACC=CAM_ASM_000666 /TAXON_ID=230516 /ORGANISM="Chaetoceros curvisetus" /LENGTH=35 /DNA_ID= /DNA_START= /DNA_END= /DNA_ORIENTATION=